MNTRIFFSIALIGSALACGSKQNDPPPVTPQPANGMNGGIPGADQGTGTTNGTVGPNGQMTQPGQTGVPTQPGQTGVPTQPGQTGQQTGTATAAGASGTAQIVDPSLAAAAAGALGALAIAEAPGAAKEGNAVAGNFQQGQTIEQSFTMQPGKCYTIVASSMGVTQLDLQATLVTPIPGMNATFGSAKGKAGVAGSQAVLGSKANCLKLALSPIPVQAKFIMTATKGAGLAAAQVYVK